MSKKLKIGMKVKYKSWAGKYRYGVIKKIVLSDEKQIKVLPNDTDSGLVAVYSYNIEIDK